MNTEGLVLFMLEALELWAFFGFLVLRVCSQAPWQHQKCQPAPERMAMLKGRAGRGGSEELGESCSAPAIQGVAQGG